MTMSPHGHKITRARMLAVHKHISYLTIPTYSTHYYELKDTRAYYTGNIYVPQKFCHYRNYSVTDTPKASEVCTV